ncbi:MAG: hypothetical protein ACREU3_07700 [Steroidobacteraceae bacterium]
MARKSKATLTGAEIARALSAAEAAGTDDETFAVLNELYHALTSGIANDDEAVRIKPGLGLLLTTAQVDEALGEVGIIRKIPRAHRDVLKRARDVYAAAEAAGHRTGSVPVTRAEFDSFCTAVALALSNIDEARQHPGRYGVGLQHLGQILAEPDVYDLSRAELAGLRRLSGLLDTAAEREGHAQRKHAAARGGRHWQPGYAT